MNDIQRTIDYFKNKLQSGISKGRKKQYENAVSAMEELQQYWAIGTVDQVKNQKHNLGVAYKMIEEYQTIGTPEECREARERQQGRKVPDIEHFGRCPECDSEFNSELLNEYNIEYCPWCGQALDWREED